MGLFDHVICEHPLPLPEEANKLKNPPEWDKFEFTTQDLSPFGGVLNKYTIGDDGQIYLELEKGGIEKQELTRELSFYGWHMEEDHDYTFSFKALFWKGDLKEIDLEEWKKISNERRLKIQKEFTEKVENITKKTKKWWFQLYLYYRMVIGFIFSLFRWFLNFFYDLCWKIERWIT